MTYKMTTMEKKLHNFLQSGLIEKYVTGSTTAKTGGGTPRRARARARPS
jgi:hypothetical protein